MRFRASRTTSNRPLALLAVSVTLDLLYISGSCAANPQPISVTPSSNFLGYDGLWSPISIRVGTPEQWLSVFPSTVTQETWTVGTGGCDGTLTCQNLRGGLFTTNASTSFQSLGPYELGSDQTMDGEDVADYGFDTVVLNDRVSVPSQIVAVLNTTDFWLGEFGLGVQESRFNGTADHLSYLSSLVQTTGDIPSHSYGYTAGAHYRLNGVPASLTLGGVDASRFIPNNATFSLSSGYVPAVTVSSITVSSSVVEASTFPSNWTSNPLTLLDDTEAGLFTIDSSTPFLWLPESVCNQFATALNLTYNDTLELYLYEDTISSPESLSTWNLTFTFSLGKAIGSTAHTDILLPYSAFDLQLSYPFPNLNANFSSPSVNYFPLRRAADSSQYRIGRAFLQEAYLQVDYERNMFSVFQALFDESVLSDPNPLAITRPDHSTWPGPSTSSSATLSTGGRIGIAVGAVAFAIAGPLLAWYICSKKRGIHVGVGEKEGKSGRPRFFARLHSSPGSGATVSELLGDKHQPIEVPADKSNTLFELSSTIPVEMPAAEVSATYFSENNRAINDPRKPAELGPRNSTRKDADVIASERSESPVPAYSAVDIGQRSIISPYGENFGTASSDEQGISPVGASIGIHSRRISYPNGNISPVSPNGSTMPRAQRQPSGDLLMPQAHNIPSRSPSRSSRFREEGILEMTQPQSLRPSRPLPPPARFSWEE